MFRNYRIPVSQGPTLPQQPTMPTSFDGGKWWQKTPRNPLEASFDTSTGIRPVLSAGVPWPNQTYRTMLYGAKKPEGVYDPRGPHNRYYGNEIVQLSGYEGYDYINPYTINAARYASLTLSPRKPPYQLQNSTPQSIAMNVVASRGVWRKWGV